MNTSLPTDSAERKTYPLVDGLFGYFPAALCAVAHHSYVSNEQHNKGLPLHWSIDKSTDHANCILRHTLDLRELLAAFERTPDVDTGEAAIDAAITEATATAWRALAQLQMLLIRFKGAPLPFNARRQDPYKKLVESIDQAADVAEARAMLGVEGYPSPRCTCCMTQPCSCIPNT